MSRLVLVIDDSASVRLTVRRMLEAEQFNVITAANGREGVELFRARQPELVITDIIMPEQEGIETILQMRREQPDAKIIAISGGGRIGNTNFLSIARRVGADDTLAKPFKREQLLRVVRSVLSGEDTFVLLPPSGQAAAASKPETSNEF